MVRTFYAPTSFRHITYNRSVASYERDDVLGLEFEAAEVARCITAGQTQSTRMPWEATLDIMSMMDDIRSQTGVVFPGE